MLRNVFHRVDRDGPLRKECSPQLQKALDGIRGNIRLGEPLSPLTSLRIGGPADALVCPLDLEDLCRLVRQASSTKVPILVMGGTNVLVSDRGFRGIVVQLIHFTAIREEAPDVLYVQAGVRFPILLQYATKRALSGMEWSAGIPGTLGGGIVMNAGTKLGEMKDVLKTIHIVNNRGIALTRSASELSFGYRKARLPKGIVIGAWLQLVKSTRKKIESVTKNYLQYRKATQPLTLPNAGSIFKNPVSKSAAWLIEQAGLKGAQIGDAQVSPKHANFVVNLGKARASDVKKLIHLVQRTVARKTGISLKLELKMVGES